MKASRQPTVRIRHAVLPHRLCTHLDPPGDTRALPPLGMDAPEDASRDWLAHIAAGRIAVR